jgi:hypothetical protein
MVIAAGSSNVVKWSLLASAREASTWYIAISAGPAPRLA